MKTRIIISNYMFPFWFCNIAKLQKKTNIGWITIAWNWLDVLGDDPDYVEHWLWYSYNKRKSNFSKCKEHFKSS